MKQAGDYLGLSFWTVRDYVLAGRLPTVELPALRTREGDRPRQRLGRVLIDLRDLDRFIEECKSGGHRDQGTNMHVLETFQKETRRARDVESSALRGGRRDAS